MKNSLRMLSASLTVLMLISAFAGCKKSPKYEYSSTFEIIDNGDTDNSDTQNGDDTGNASAGSNKNNSTAGNNSGTSGNKGTAIGDKGSTSGSGGSSGKQIKNDIEIKSGNTPAENGLNLNGKTILWVSPWEVDSKYYTQFQNKYNCKIDKRILSFNTYAQQVASLVASGNKIDIGYIYGGQFPQIVVKNLWQPLQNSITTADLSDNSNPDKGGIDIEKSKLLGWNNNLYGLVGYYSTEPNVLYYNKKLLKSNGYDADPLLNYYKQGKWTYDTLKSFGKEFLKDTGVYFGTTDMYAGWLTSNSAVYIKYVNGTPTENLSDPKVYNALKFVSDISTGSDAILKFFKNQTAKDVFTSGNVLCYKEQISEYASLKEKAASSSAFGNDASNVGIVQLPKGPDSKDEYITTSAVTGWACGVGSQNPTAAVAWAKMMIADNCAELKNRCGLTEEQFDYYIRKPLQSHSIVRSYYGFATSSTSMSEIAAKIESEVYLGGDITSILNNYRQQVKNCIDVCMKQQ